MKSCSLRLAHRFLLNVALCLTSFTAQAQWVSEQYPLKAGWNAVFLHIDASHATLNELIGSDPSNPIQEIWMWAPPGPAMQFFDSVQAPLSGSSEWVRWDRYWAGASPLQRLPGNVAALVRVDEAVANYTWTLVGKPMPPRPEWTSTGLNFIGFTTTRGTGPLWSDFLGPVRSLHDNAEIYRYVGGPLNTSNPQRLFSSLLRNVRMERNHAYWVRAEEYNRYFGPFEVELQALDGIHFGTRRGQFRMRLRNRIDEPVTVTAELVASLPAPTGEESIAGLIPLILRGEQDMSTLEFGFSRFREGNGQWTLPPASMPGSDIEVVVGLDRSEMSGSPGDLFAGVLRLRDATGLMLVDLPVSAHVADTRGLWVGNAIIGEVAHYLVDYTTGDDGRPTLNPDGSFAIEVQDEAMMPVARPMPLRLLVHNPASGSARLLQRVYYGANEAGQPILAHVEGELATATLDEARRISVIHLPWSEANRGWPFDGALGPGADIRTQVITDYADHSTQPFVHTFHPDHDNLDARFENELPRGVESYDVVREITLKVMPPGGDFSGITEGSGLLAGEYTESVILRGRSTDAGAHARTFRSRGGFALSLLTEIDALQGYTEAVVVPDPDPVPGPDLGSGPIAP